jgi:type I restriction enzyme S subunit
MTDPWRPVGTVLTLDREPVTVQPDELYRAIGVRSFGKGIFEYPPTRGDQLSKLRFFDLAPERLVLSNIKAWEGALAVSGVEHKGCVASNRFLQYRPLEPSVVDLRFLRYFFLSAQGNRLLQKASPGAADRNRTLGIERFEALRIPLPPFDEQQRLADRLDEAFGLMAAVDELRLRAARSRQALGAALACRADLTDAERAGAGWTQLDLSRILRLDVNAVPVAEDAAFDLAGVYSFGRGIFTRGPLRGSDTKYTELHRLRAGQIVMSKLKAWEGALAFVTSEHDGYVLSPEFPTFTVDEGLAVPGFLGMLVTAEPFWSQLLGQSRGVGARRERVSPTRFLDRQVWLPPLEEQLRAVRILKDCQALQALEDRQLVDVGLLRANVLTEAFSNF